MIPWVFHQPYEPYAYAVEPNVARVVLLVERRTARKVTVRFGDRYEPNLTDQVVMEYVGDDGQYDHFEADVQIPSRRLKYAFEIQLQDGRTLFYGDASGAVGLQETLEEAGVFQLAYLTSRDLYEVPEWVNHSVCYQIFPERFCNGNPDLTPRRAVAWDAKPTAKNMFGGDLPGITQKLDYLHDIGVNLIYLTPIFKAKSNHKYDTTDYLQIDPQFGTKEDLRELVEAAHARGIRIVLDAVFNHCGFRFRPFQDVVKKGKASKYWDWFFIDGDEVDTENVNYETFATRLRYMPKLNVANPEVEKYLLKVATYWIKEFDIDGWRLDVANEVDHVFWRNFRTAVRQAKPDALIIGEVWHNSLPWLRGDQFDGVMNYVFREACLNFFVHQKIDADTFAKSIVRLLHMYPEPATRSMFNLLGSHDTERILTLANDDVDAVLLAMTFQFTYPGIPMVYYGDEVGMQGGRDPDCRRGMVWDEPRQNRRIQNAVRELSNLKRREPALSSAKLRLISAEGDVLVFERMSGDGTDVIRIAINRGDSPAKVGHHDGQHVRLLFSTRPEALAHDGVLPAKSAVVWKVTCP
jgi:glycosidase